MSKPTPQLSSVKLARRERLLDVAENLFVSQGFRATTIEGLADAAGLSKVTVYRYFPDKTAAFEAVATRLADRMRTAVMTQLQADLPIADRISNALVAKHTMVHDLVRTSVFASELMAQKAIFSQIFNTLDAELITEIAKLLSDPQAARILFNSALGIANSSTSTAALQADIRRLVSGFLT